MPRELDTIIDDPYQETTEEQKEKVLFWFNKIDWRKESE